MTTTDRASLIDIATYHPDPAVKLLALEILELRRECEGGQA